MSSNDLPLGAEFPAAARPAWEALALKALAGAPLDKLTSRTADGLAVQPIYFAEDWPAEGDPSGFPGADPFARGGLAPGAADPGWGIEPLHAHPSLEATNGAILIDLERGATGIVLRLDRAGRNGRQGDAEGVGEDGVMIASVDDLDAVLRGVLLDLAPVRLQAGGQFFAASAMLAALWRRRGIDPKAARGAFGADPLGALAEEGVLPFDLETQMEAAAALALHTAGHYPSTTSLAVDGSLWHAAGATEAQELGCVLATGLAYVKAAMTVGLGVDAACRQIEFTLAADENFFGTIAKLRAARMTWARLAEACGASLPARAMRLRAATAQRMMTRRDPWVNMLRTTSACFAAGVAGAEAVTVLPFSAALGLPDGFARRIARNTQIILQEESSLHRVMDPAGGSWYLENLTEALAAAGWREFQAIETEGGMAEAVLSGKIQKRVASAAAAREKSIATRREPITGVSEFAHLREESVEIETEDLPALRKAAQERIEALKVARGPLKSAGDLAGLKFGLWIDAAAAGATLAELAASLGDGAVQARPLVRRRKAEGFEALRDASDSHLHRKGARPRIFLANMGSVAQHTARAMYALNFFEAGGIEAVTSEGFADAPSAARAFAASGAPLAVICGSDTQYAADGAAFARALKSAGASRVYLAGRPGELEAALREAGVDEFIFMGCDVLGTLRSALTHLGVAAS